MRKLRFVYWQEDEFWFGYFEQYPDYWTQGRTLLELKKHLKDLHKDLSGNKLPGIRKVGELAVS